MKCEKCGTENRAGAIICTTCGRLLPQPTQGTTRSLGDTDYEEGFPKWGSARFNKTKLLVLDVLEASQQFVFDPTDLDEILIGRSDPVSGTNPLIDLTDSGGADKGVSRQHAKIIRREGALHIMDNSSSNGTFLNGQRLVADQPRILRDGDDIRLGHLVLRVSFRTTPQQSSAE